MLGNLFSRQHKIKTSDAWPEVFIIALIYYCYYLTMNLIVSEPA